LRGGDAAYVFGPVLDCPDGRKHGLRKTPPQNTRTIEQKALAQEADAAVDGGRRREQRHVCGRVAQGGTRLIGRLPEHSLGVDGQSSSRRVVEHVVVVEVTVQQDARPLRSAKLAIKHLGPLDERGREWPVGAPVVGEALAVISGVPAEISTSYAERSNLSIRMASRRFTRLTNGFSKKIEHHLAAISLYVAWYNLCRVHEALTPNMANQNTPAMALGITDRAWSIGQLIDAALATQPIEPIVTAPDRRRRFRVIEGGKK
jgi:hypothetical protein